MAASTTSSTPWPWRRTRYSARWPSSTTVCGLDEIALSVLTTVIGHQPERGWIMIDAGWMALSRDRGTQEQAVDRGYGMVCDVAGTVLDGWTVSGANQERGMVACTRAGAQDNIEKVFPIGTRLRILPNHACATGAQHGSYHVLRGADASRTWPRFTGW